MAVTTIQAFRGAETVPFDQAVAKEIAENRFCYLQGDTLKEQLPFYEDAAWHAFATSWNHLCRDLFMKDNGKYRLRRFSEWEYRAQEGELHPIPSRPYVQPLYINPLNGGIERQFEPFEQHVQENPFFLGLVNWCLQMFGGLEEEGDWDVQIFQNRIVAEPNQVGLPTPEGAHRDGVSYILMMLIGRENVDGGETTLYDEERQELGELTLQSPLDCVLAHDERTMHGVTSIRAAQPDQQGHRDMLIAMFTKR